MSKSLEQNAPHERISPVSFLVQQIFLEIPAKYMLGVTVRRGCNQVSGTGRKHHLHRKTYILPCELRKCHAFSDLSVGYTMFFSRRWMICCRINELREAPVLTVTRTYHNSSDRLQLLAPHKQILAHLMDTALHEKLHSGGHDLRYRKIGLLAELVRTPGIAVQTGIELLGGG